MTVNATINFKLDLYGDKTNSFLSRIDIITYPQAKDVGDILREYIRDGLTVACEYVNDIDGLYDYYVPIYFEDVKPEDLSALVIEASKCIAESVASFKSEYHTDEYYELYKRFEKVYDDYHTDGETVMYERLAGKGHRLRNWQNAEAYLYTRLFCKKTLTPRSELV